jgi:hypothetical protein
MASELQSSALLLELQRIIAGDGSPYFNFDVIIHSAGKEISPLQVIRYDIGRDYRTAYTDALSLVLSLGVGTVMNDIGPFQDDLRITVNISNADGRGNQRTAEAVLSSTYVAYLADEIPRPTDSGYDPSLQDTETANRNGIRHVAFVLEEVAVSQLRKSYLGFIGRSSPPFEVMRALLVRYSQAIKLAADEAIRGFDLVAPNNTTPRNHVMIPDGTNFFSIPDLIQNKQGGIYSTGLGFYIQDRMVYTWPMYDTARQDSASRMLQVIMAPNRQSVAVDKTWINEDRMLSVYSAGISKIEDDTLGKLNQQGNAVRFNRASKLVDGVVSVGNNKMVASRSANNSEFSTTVVGNAQNVAPVSSAPVTDNIYLEASKLAMRSGAILYLPWLRSNPALITPGMAVEILYDYGGIIRTIKGSLLMAPSSYEMEGSGMMSERIFAKTTLVVFVDRNDPDYLAYMQGGGTVSPTPQIDTL